MVVESDKADMDVEAFESGFLARIIVPEGSVAPVGVLFISFSASFSSLICTDDFHCSPFFVPETTSYPRLRRCPHRCLQGRHCQRRLLHRILGRRRRPWYPPRTLSATLPAADTRGFQPLHRLPLRRRPRRPRARCRRG
jgi:hypothetical protein